MLGSGSNLMGKPIPQIVIDLAENDGMHQDNNKAQCRSETQWQPYSGQGSSSNAIALTYENSDGNQPGSKNLEATLQKSVSHTRTPSVQDTSSSRSNSVERHDNALERVRPRNSGIARQGPGQDQGGSAIAAIQERCIKI
ncbi:hypothetical protein BC829DRAFT_438857 [Chytridium lagenaria]|nr:hypothetical protein BC829DRAFT_438857 [Chytridium lagenaria]